MLLLDAGELFELHDPVHFFVRAEDNRVLFSKDQRVAALIREVELLEEVFFEEVSVDVILCRDA